jgi:DNA mismatch repair protein MutS2
VRASYESDVRGLTADEAAAVVDKHLDTALLGGLREIKVIHGMGTGVLLATVRGILSQHPRVKSFRSGESREGGAGVTIAELED